MSKRVIISSDHIDRHGDLLTKEALESGAKIINGDRKVRWSVEHKRDLPPLGKIINAKVENLNDHYYLTVEQIKYDIYENVEWHQDLVKASCSEDNNPLNEPNFEVPDKLKVSLDRHNFRSNQEYENYIKILKQGHIDFEIEEFSRKSYVNDLEIVIRLAEYYTLYRIFKPIIQKIADKIIEKVSDKIAIDSEKIYDFIKLSAKSMLNSAIPKNRSINYIIQIPGNPEIELFAKIKDPDLLIKALRNESLKIIEKEIIEFQDKIIFEKIQFTLTDKGKWKFNYLLTDKGETIGRKISFKKRDKKIELIYKMNKEKNM